MKIEEEQKWKDFGKWFADERKKAGLTQQNIADDIDMHVNHISRIENGEPTKRSTIIKMAEAANIDKITALQKAGFMHKGVNVPPELQILNYEVFDDNEIAEIRDYIQLLIEVKEKQEKAKENKLVFATLEDWEKMGLSVYEINEDGRIIPADDTAKNKKSEDK